MVLPTQINNLFYFLCSLSHSDVIREYDRNMLVISNME